MFPRSTPRMLRITCLVLAGQLGPCGPAAHAASPAPVAAEQGMVVTAQHLATRIGVQVLADGGNAVDAAVAVGYALAVVYPAAGNLGGGGFMTLQRADGRKTFIDFREQAPLAATRDMYLDAEGQTIPGASTLGHRAVAVPGSVAGLELALARHGTQPRAALIAPALRLAEQGFVLQQGDVDILSTAVDGLRRDAPSAAIFLRDGALPAAGDLLVQKDLARTLRHISEQGAAGFYQGPVAAAIVASSRAGGGCAASGSGSDSGGRRQAGGAPRGVPIAASMFCACTRPCSAAAANRCAA